MTTGSKLTYYPTIIQGFGITGLFIVSMVLFTPLNIGLSSSIGEEAAMLIYYLCTIGIPFAAIYLIRKKKSGHLFNFKIENKRIVPILIVSAITLLFGIVNPISSLIPIPESIKDEFIKLERLKGIYTFILMVIAAPVLEELIFRGIILEGFLKNYSPLKSILLSSFLFGIVHLNPWQFIAGLIYGVFIGWVYFRNRNLYFSIIIHAVVNLSSFLMRHFVDIETLLDQNLVRMYGGLANLILAITLSVTLLYFSIWYLNKFFGRKNATS